MKEKRPSLRKTEETEATVRKSRGSNRTEAHWQAPETQNRDGNKVSTCALAATERCNSLFNKRSKDTKTRNRSWVGRLLDNSNLSGLVNKLPMYSIDESCSYLGKKVPSADFDTTSDV